MLLRSAFACRAVGVLGVQLGWAEAASLRSWKHAVFFGQNLITLQPRGIIRVGQAVQVRPASPPGLP